MRDTRILVFEPFRLDVRDERLWRGDEPVRLTNKAFSVLRFLSAHPDQLVTKDELLDAVWPDAVVSEAAMAVCIRELRQALGDDARAPQYIETVRGRGYRFLAPVQVVGRSEPLPAADVPARPLRAEGVGKVPPWVTGPASPVGREPELARLHQWFAAAQRGARRVGFIVGEVGIGKTTLVDAFAAQVRSEAGPWIGRGQCVDQYGAGEAYLPLLEALGRLCRGTGGGRFLDLLRQYAPNWLAQMPALLAETDRPALAAERGGATPARMLRELAEAVEALTAERPLVLVLEDLHWSDASTLAWLGYVARRREAARLLVLGTYRPVEAIVSAQPLRALTAELRGRGQCEELLLDYLPETSVAAYLVARCPGRSLPPGLAHTLHQRTDGNPLFLVTLVETLVQQGALSESPEGWALPRGLEAVTVGVPESLRRLIELHLEQTDPDDQALLEAASVAGAEFSAAAVAAGVEAGEGDVEARCEVLARQGRFIDARGPAAWPDGTVVSRYGFVHALHQEVLYDRIPAGQRARLHRQIGLRLEAGHAGQVREIAAELAEHFVRGQDAPRAIQYLRLAGESARQRSAYQEAIAHLERGLEALATLPDTAERARQEVELQTVLGMTYMAAKGFAAPEVGSAYQRALALCHPMEDTARLAPVLSGLWIFHLTRAELGAAQDMGQRLLELGQSTRDPAALASAHHGLGQILVNTGEFVSADAHLEQALALFRRHPPSSPAAIRTVQDGQAISLGNLAISLWHLGYPDRALQRVQECLALARELSHPFTVASTLRFAAVVHWCRGEKALAQERNEEMLALAVEQGFPPFVAGGTFAKNAMLLEQGKMPPVEGIAEMRRSLDDLRTTGAELGLPQTLIVMATVEAAMGLTEDAFARVAEAQRVVERTGERCHEAALCLLRGALLLGQAQRRHTAGEPGKELAEAEAEFRHAIDVARRQQANSLELQAAMHLGRLWQRQGRREEARELLGQVHGWFTEGFDTADLKAAEAMLEELAG